MNAELPYLKRIADAIGKINLGDVQSGASQNAGAGNVAVTATVEAPGVAETLDMGLLNTVIEEEETIKTSAVKAMADSIKSELLAAFFKEENGVRTNLLESIHFQLRNVSDYSTLQGLRDVSLTDGPNDGDFLVWKEELNGNQWLKWTNIPSDDILQQLLGSEEIGGADTLGDYHAVYWGGASFIPIPSGAIADPLNNPAARYPVLGWQVYSYLSGKAAVLDVIKSTDLANNDSYFPSLQGDGYIPTAYAVYTYLNKHYKIASSPDDLDNSGDLITGAILTAYVNEHGGATPSLNGLSDTDLGTLANNNFLYYDSTAQKWKNATRATALQKLVGTSSAIGGGSGNKSPIYWTGSQFSAITLSEGAYRSVITNVNQIASGETSLVPAGLLASKLGNYLQATIVTSISASSTYQNTEVAAAGAVVDFVTGQVNSAVAVFSAFANKGVVTSTTSNYMNYFTGTGGINKDNFLPTAGAVAKYVADTKPTALNDLTTDVSIAGPSNNDFFVYSSSLSKWTNISNSNVLQSLMGSNAIGGQASANTMYRPIYWGGAAFLPIPAGSVASGDYYPVCGNEVYTHFLNTAANMGVDANSVTSSTSKVPTSYAVLQYVNKITDASISTWNNNTGCLTGAAMYGYLQESSLKPVTDSTNFATYIAQNDNTRITTGGAVWGYINAHLSSAMDKNIGTAASCSLDDGPVGSAYNIYGSDSIIMTQRRLNYTIRNFISGTISYDEDSIKTGSNEIVTGSAVRAALQYYGLIS